MSRRTPRRPGRRTLLTPAVESALLEAISAGVPVTQAAVHAGISPSTFHAWMARGEDAAALVDDGGEPAVEEEPYRVLHERVSRARAQVAVSYVGIVQKVAEGGYPVRTRLYRDPATKQIVTEVELAPPDWRAAQFLLRSSFSRDFAAGQLAVTGGDGGPVRVEHGVTPEVADLAARLREFQSRPAPAVNGQQGTGRGPNGDGGNGRVIEGDWSTH